MPSGRRGELLHRLLVQAALDRGPAGAAAFRSWRARVDLRDIDYPSQRVLPAIQEHLGDDELGRAIRKAVRFTWLRSQLLFSTAAKAIEVLDAAGVPVMLIKGAAVLYHTGLDIALRPMEDIDIAVPVGRISQAAAAMTAAGFASRAAQDLISDPGAITPDVHSYAFTDARHAEVDLHWRLFKASRWPGADEGFWERSVEGRLRETRVRVLSREDLLVQLFANKDDGSAASWALDSIRLLDGPPLDWDLVFRQADLHELKGICSDSLLSLARLSPAHVPEVVVKRARRDRALETLVGFALRPVRQALKNASLYKDHAGRTRLDDVWKVERAWRAALREPPASKRAPTLRLGDRVSFVQTGREYRSPYCRSGWWYSEDGGTWSSGPYAGVELPLHEATDEGFELVLKVVPLTPPGRSKSRVDFFIDGRKVSGHGFRGAGLSTREIVVKVPPRRGRAFVNLGIRVDVPLRPIDIGFNADQRLLGILLAEIELRPQRTGR